MIRIVLLGNVSASTGAANAVAASNNATGHLPVDLNLCDMVRLSAIRRRWRFPTQRRGSPETDAASKSKSAHTGTQTGRPGRIINKNGTHEHIVQQPPAA